MLGPRGPAPVGLILSEPRALQASPRRHPQDLRLGPNEAVKEDRDVEMAPHPGRTGASGPSPGDVILPNRDLVRPGSKWRRKPMQEANWFMRRWCPFSSPN